MRYAIRLCLLVLTTTAAIRCVAGSEETAAVKQTAGYDRARGDPKQSRSVVLATHGMVATSHPLAAQVGLDVLKSGYPDILKKDALRKSDNIVSRTPLRSHLTCFQDYIVRTYQN